MTRASPADRAGDPLVEVVRSARRRKTVSARLVDGVITVRAPAAMPAAELDHHVDRLVARLLRGRAREHTDLDARARELAARYGLPVPASIRFVSNQRHRWGSCTPVTGEIRISDRLAGAPDWVIDHVVLHELAHLVEPGHGPRFRAIVERYPWRERAEGFLLGLIHEPLATPAPARRAE